MIKYAVKITIYLSYFINLIKYDHESCNFVYNKVALRIGVALEVLCEMVYTA